MMVLFFIFDFPQVSVLLIFFKIWFSLIYLFIIVVIIIYFFSCVMPVCVNVDEWTKGTLRATVMLALALSVRNAIGTWIRKTSAGCGRKLESVQSLGRARKRERLENKPTNQQINNNKRKPMLYIIILLNTIPEIILYLYQLTYVSIFMITIILVSKKKEIYFCQVFHFFVVFLFCCYFAFVFALSPPKLER